MKKDCGVYHSFCTDKQVFWSFVGAFEHLLSVIASLILESDQAGPEPWLL